MMTYTLKVLEIFAETYDTHTIKFKQPGLKKIKYLPGQYLTVMVDVNGRKFRRPYSFSSTPGMDPTLDITIKRVPKGMVSNHLIDTVKEGDLIEVMEPRGDFVYDPQVNGSKEIYLWGAGSGVTPLMSILKSALADSNSKIVMVYCNTKISETIFYDRLMQLRRDFQERFALNLFCTRENSSMTIPGRITKDHIADVLLRTENISNTIHYICGPHDLKQAIQGELITKGLNSDQIFSENFENVIDESQLINIQTRMVGIIKDGNEYSLEVIRGKSILEAGLEKDLDLPYSCQTGSCALCKAKLVSGEVRILTTEKSSAELLPGEFLLCCSFPLTDNVKFETY